MGRIGIINSFRRTEKLGMSIGEATVEIGGDERITAQLFESPGGNSVPKIGDWVHVASQPGTGRWSIVGWIDPKNKQKAQDGDQRSYARDSNGNVVVESWLKNDGSGVMANNFGTIELTPHGAGIISNDFGIIELKENGEINLNGIIIKANGEMIVPTKITAPSVSVSGREINNHTHNILSGSSAPGPTGINN